MRQMKRFFFLSSIFLLGLLFIVESGIQENLYAQVSPANVVAAFKTLKDSPSKVDSINKLCRGMEDNVKLIVFEIQVLKIAEKLNYPKGLAQALNNIGVAFYNQGNGNVALVYHNKALSIRTKLNEKKDIAASYNNIGNAYDKIGNKKEAITFHTKALKIKEEIKDSIGMARSYNNIASAYLDLPDYYKAIDNGFLALRIFEKLHNRTEALAETFNNLGIAYQNLKELDKAMVYYQQALTIHQELSNRTEIALMLNNIANIYELQGESPKFKKDEKLKLDSALEKYSKALFISEELEDQEMVALVNSNIGNVYWYLHNFSKALTHLNKALSVYEKLGNKIGIATAYNNLCKHYKLQKKFSQSNTFGLKALVFADSIKDFEQIQNACTYLNENYFALKQFEKSLFYYKRQKLADSTLTDVEGAKKLVQKESKMEFEKREGQLKLEQEKQNVIKEAKNRQQRIIIWAASIGLILVIIFSAFIFNRFRVTQKQNKIIEEQNREMDGKNHALEGANAEIEQKNKDITDSIQYAKRIQRALLASDSLLKKNLPEYFILYKPKDIVSGDFYWANYVNGKFLIITADCTGHGVPGAFMSLLNISLLNEITLQRKISAPDQVLNNVRDQIISILNPEGTETEGKDGMDCMLCSFDIKNNELQFAAANNPLWVLKNGAAEITEYKADKQPVGFHSVYKPFTLQTTSLAKGDTVYSFTDGFADQFGGPKGKKFKYKQLEELLLKHAHLPMNEQKNILEKSFEEWIGALEQIDDVLIIGVRI